MMTLRLATMTVDQVRAKVRDVLAHGLDIDEMADFLSSVDWGGAPGTPEVQNLLGVLEMATTEYGEGDRTRDEYRKLLESLMLDGPTPFPLINDEADADRHPDIEPRPADFTRPDGGNNVIFRLPEGDDGSQAGMQVF